MFTARQAVRNAPRFAAQARAGAQRRFASSASENEFIKERQHIKDHAKGTTELWKKISIYGVTPCLIAAGANAYYLWNEHWEHWSHMPALEDRTEYAYQNIRTKNYQWGNGDETLFWNDKVNYHNKDKVA
ncbi:Cytochrome c oxidase, subunit VIa [Cordyceps fumosorosea ARSEF 2679]|uniref:Cytochrome c oxidase subunit 13, mitochondrial n=1 Tax=Cordyceps fumosorosea (strain ARSEF 2679) TaxID=1081104 RepID=A0A167T125_CORFA|nr:Cytochrome c oxidase, subunit VIa [Cordyceps fumosorosea ARSEF 2679]OAA60138.1 Cytochrome c oxidase, subunit VIa [Cordyceps fumosorosea ARSEF 2679]